MEGGVLIRFVGPAHSRRIIGQYRWRPGDVHEVDEETAAYCLAEPGGSFELVEEDAAAELDLDEWEVELGLEKRG